jgi:hypothetical protein
MGEGSLSIPVSPGRGRARLFARYERKKGMGKDTKV